MIAYGQTGSGKTHLMNGAARSSPGLVPWAIEQVMARMLGEASDADAAHGSGAGADADAGAGTGEPSGPGSAV